MKIIYKNKNKFFEVEADGKISEDKEEVLSLYSDSITLLDQKINKLNLLKGKF